MSERGERMEMLQDKCEELQRIIDLQTRALLAVEWGNADEHLPGNGVCPLCHGVQWPENENHGHDACPLNAALNAAGLDTQEKRDAAREKTRCEMCASAPGFCPKHAQAPVVAGHRVEPNR